VDEAIPAISRIVHVGTAIVLIGGSAFMRFVLMPAAEGLADEDHEALKARLMRRWKFVVHGGIALLLASGLYNYLAVAMKLHPTGGAHATYHMLIGIKILLALVLFVMAAALVGRAAVFEGLRANAHRTLVIMLVIASAIVAVSGYLRVHEWPTAGPV